MKLNHFKVTYSGLKYNESLKNGNKVGLMDCLAVGLKT